MAKLTDVVSGKEQLSVAVRLSLQERLQPRTWWRIIRFTADAYERALTYLKLESKARHLGEEARRVGNWRVFLECYDAAMRAAEQALRLSYAVSSFAGNIFLDEGKDDIWNLVVGAAGVTNYSNANARCGVGDSTTAESASQTGLLGANQLFKAQDTGFPSTITNGKRFQSTFGTAEANFAWNEFCLTPDTDVLTSRGWKPIEEVRIGELAPTRAPDGTIVELPVVGTPAFDYEGELIVYDTEHVKLAVTPQHRVLVKSERDRLMGRGFRLVPAEKVTRGMWEMVNGGRWQGVSPETWTIPLHEGANASSRAWTFPIRPFLRFLGYWISEGGAEGHGGVGLAQSLTGNPSVAARMLQTVHEMGLSPHVYKEKEIRVGGTPLARWLQEFGKTTSDKRVPDFVKRLSPDLIWEFLGAYLEGGGHLSANGARIVSTTSPRLADDLQELALKAGITASLSRIPHGTWGDAPQYRLVFSQSPLTPTVGDAGAQWQRPRREHYKGLVHCLTVPFFHTIYVRRQGHPVWTGNSVDNGATALQNLNRKVSAQGTKPSTQTWILQLDLTL